MRLLPKTPGVGVFSIKAREIANSIIDPGPILERYRVNLKIASYITQNRVSAATQNPADHARHGVLCPLSAKKRGTPKAVLISIRDYVKLAAPEPDVLRIIGEDSQRNGTNTLTSRQIDQVIKATRAQKKKR
jgi:hypothetical protein